MAARGLRRSHCVFDARVPDPILNKLEVCPCFQEVCSDGVLKLVEVRLCSEISANTLYFMRMVSWQREGAPER